MAKILSQDEIDALLSTVSEEASEIEGLEGAPSKRVILYDFKHPNLISKEQMRLLENIHESFSRNFGVFLSAQLRMIVEIDLLAIDQLLYSEFVMSIAPPGCLYVIAMEQPPGEVILELSPALVIFIVEKLFGGKGVFSSTTSRPISVIEQRIMGKVIDRATAEMSNVWSPVAELKTKVTRFESNPEFIQIIPSAEPVVVVSLQVKIHDNKTLMNFCYPYRWLAEMVGRPAAAEAAGQAGLSARPPRIRRRADALLGGEESSLQARHGAVFRPGVGLGDELPDTAGFAGRLRVPPRGRQKSIDHRVVRGSQPGRYPRRAGPDAIRPETRLVQGLVRRALFGAA